MKAFSTLLKLKDSNKFEWREEHQTTFTQIKVSLSTPSVLVPPCRGKPLKLYILAAAESIGCLLAQDNDVGREQAIFYLSCNLNSSELNYSPIEKLCLALFFAASKLQHYMLPSVTQLDFSCTNNQAEYEALIIGLHVFHDLRASRVLVLGDSELKNKPYKGRGDFLWRNVKVFILWMKRRFGRRLRLNQRPLPTVGHRRIQIDSCLDHRRRMDGRKVGYHQRYLCQEIQGELVAGRMSCTDPETPSWNLCTPSLMSRRGVLG
ncbi:hypothetical protein D8674_008620 [Pyrus ussuriensis x Pyrus communis]|uniref:Reverse transcriptase/retrotransposon-derived protein RNase H-like domain-containing protein n=1 Tax=Pyrus ussuriensis x Pyrus communis TaxID=2448454 RepID=A0A5N5HY40_9ROSA|nr:hypothetical protein D8674_008620 [Pyrus ussuriensis x Pyrus communis]